jgi:bromodomain-containing factor 1
MGLPDYPQVIKYPMDLGTVRDLLTESQLADPDHFAENVRLTFKNAMTYNIPGSYIYTSAEALLEVFERKFASWQRARDKGTLANNFRS